MLCAMNGKQQRWVDLARVVAAILVVSVHASGPVVAHFNEVSRVDWWVANVYDAAAKICVPLFFMLSGHLLLGKIEPLAGFFTKRLSKVVVPWLAWSALYLAWSDHLEHRRHGLLDGARAILAGPVYYHLWFLYALLGLYLFTPVLRVYASRAPRSDLIYFVAIWFVTVAVLPGLQEFAGLEVGINLPSFTGYVGYFVLGRLIGEAPCSPRRVRLSAALFAAAYTITVLGTYLLTSRRGAFHGFLYAFLSPSMIVASGAALYLLKALGARLRPPPVVDRLISALCAQSFGIYLVHPFVMDVLAEERFGIGLHGRAFHASLAIPATIAVTLVVSALMTALLRRIPVLRQLVP
jgi:surface polysaccharide O-acyltransferase-like enzyme